MIHFHPETRVFFLQLASSFYALQIRPSGLVVHVGSGTLPGNFDSTSDAGSQLANLDAYEDSRFVFDDQAVRQELPAFGDVSYHAVALQVVFPGLAGTVAAGDARNVPIRDVRLRYESHEIRTDAAPGLSPNHGRPARKSTTPRETLRVILKDSLYDFRVALNYRLTPEHDVIERWVDLENQTGADVEVARLAFGTLHLPSGKYEITRIGGNWAREFTPIRQTLEQGRFVLDHRGLNTGHRSNPIFLANEQGAATEDGGAVWFGALAFSGNWCLDFEALPDGALRIHGGYETGDFALALAPGDSHRTPAFVHGCCADGRGGASRRLHRFVRDYVLPGYGPGEFRPVLYNSWEATYFELSEDNQIALARTAASLGVELFVMDDGWFGARRSDRAGLGDWTVSRELFPNGLQPVIDEVRRLGMRFGLWIEPEMVNPDSDLYRAHPDWTLHFPGRPRTEMRNQLILDFGRPEVVEHIFTQLDQILRENDIQFLKWDMNRCATEPGSVAGRAIWRKHVEGVYSIMDRLRARHPGLEVQSCSSGGGRVDLGVLARTDQVWTSDNTDAHDRTQIQDGFSLAYPPRVMEAWVTHATNHQTGRSASLDLRFDVAMRGALGIGSALNELSPEELEAYRRRIAFYKRIRPVVQEGDLYRLKQTPGFSIWLTVLTDASRAVYSSVVLQHPLGLHPAPMRLQGLEPSAIYALTDAEGADLGCFSGFQLLTLGLPSRTAFGGYRNSVRSRTVLLEKVSTDR